MQPAEYDRWSWALSALIVQLSMASSPVLPTPFQGMMSAPCHTFQSHMLRRWEECSYDGAGCSYIELELRQQSPYLASQVGSPLRWAAVSYAGWQARPGYTNR